MAADPRKSWLDPSVAAYASAHSRRPDPILRGLIEETRSKLGPRAGMQISPDHGVLMEMLARATGAREAIEVGTFTGYSALCTARGMPEDGHLLCCDVSEEWTAIGRRYWERAGVGHKIELRIGPALDTLRSLPPDERVDLAFVDADKPNYYSYFTELVPRVKPGGLILVDNTIWGGRVVDDGATEENTVAIRAFNDAVAADDRVVCLLLPFDDGLTFLLKR
jgi:caffeoyl-CoA O-methyltransferase